MVNENAIRSALLLGLLACGVTGYLLGSINSAIIVTRLFKQIGSASCRERVYAPV